MEQIKWYTLYSKFSKCLNEFYNTYKSQSGELLYKTYIKKDENLDILPWIKNFKQYNVTSIDPIHVFASFNYWRIPAETRKKRMKLFCELIKSNNIDIDNLLYEIEAADLNIFKYFPHINITYIVSARDNNQQKEVWEFFSLIYNNQQNKRFEKLFDKINNDWFGVRLQSATIFMFWINSDQFMPLDKNTYALLKEYDALDTFPTSFDKYKKLLELNSHNLYRNLTRIAIDKQLKNDLPNKEQQNIDNFLNSNYSFNDTSENLKYVQENILDIDLIPSFNFELYIMINGKVMKIIYTGDEITYYAKMKLTITKSNGITYPNFQLIAIKALNDEYTKVLESNKIYYFNDNFEIQNNNIKLINEKCVSLYTGYSINNINISAIVGKNGMGKSTIIELLIMAINNIALGLKSYNDNSIKELEDFFYTIHTNYSLHSLNEKHYNGKWLHKLFHKNDAYQTPIVIEPYRDSGNIDVNKLEDLTQQRLISTLLEPNLNNNDENNNLKLTDNQSATHLSIIPNIKKISNMIYYIRKEEDKTKVFFTQTFEEEIEDVLNYQENQNIIDYFEIESFTKSIDDRSKNTMLPNFIEPSNHVILPNFTEHINDNKYLYHIMAKLYICYKVKSIAETYSIYNGYINNINNIDFLSELIKDESHITFKLHQSINFIKYQTIEKISLITLERSKDKKNNKINFQKKPNYNPYEINVNTYIPIEEISSNIRRVKENNTELTTISIIPPAFFEINIIIDNNKPFHILSSGEKQKIYAISSIIYHLQNIESVHRGNSKNIKYNYVNLILDEIELYFHPDMQRTFISDLLKGIQQKCAFDNITGLNILLVTHSPFILSDILKSNILYLDNKNINTNELHDTFGANIHTLLDNSFFMQNGLMGKYSKDQIEYILKKLNNHKNEISKQKNKQNNDNLIDKLEQYRIKQIVANIGEPFLKKKIFDMYFSLFDENKNQISMLERERNFLNEKIEKLKNDTN